MSFNNIRPANDRPDNTLYQRIPAAARISGLSQNYLRQGCKNGTIQHRKSGRFYYVYMPGLDNPGPGGGGCPNS